MSSCKCLRLAPLCYQKESVIQINVFSQHALNQSGLCSASCCLAAIQNSSGEAAPDKLVSVSGCRSLLRVLLHLEHLVVICPRAPSP